MLQTIAGGANARPFTTHHHALDIPMKLRICLELYLKRMLVGGVERVYELGRNFRNEGIDRDHNPEFTMLEAYQAYGDYHTMMELSETLVRECARAVNPIVGRAADDLVIPVRGRMIDLAEPFAADHGPRRGVGGRRRADHARAPRPPRRRGAPRGADRRCVGPGQDRAGAVREAGRGHDRAADVRLRLPARGLAAGAAAPRRPRPHRALRSGRRGRRARHRVLRAHRPGRAAREVRAPAAR